MYYSHRRRPAPSALIFLDSDRCRNDEAGRRPRSLILQRPIAHFGQEDKADDRRQD